MDKYDFEKLLFLIYCSVSDPDPDPYQETIDMDPGSVKN